jgi:cell division protein FtsI (penicillin-binding protein 3)
MTQRGGEPGPGARRPGTGRPRDGRPRDGRPGDGRPRRPDALDSPRRPARSRPPRPPRPPRQPPQQPPRQPPRSGRPPRWVRISRGDSNRRLGLTLLAIAFVLTMFAGRLVQIQGMESGTYKQLAARERLQTITLPAMRGTITGANGQVLAMTVQTYTVTADPEQVPGKPRVAGELAGPLGMPPARILNLLEHPSSPEYVVLATGVPAENGDKIAAMQLAGISLSANYSRAYPDGDATANVVGFTNVSQSDVISGQAGIEEAYNRLLSGTQGSEQMEFGDFNGANAPIPGTETKVTPPVNGSSIRLTIIPALQFDAQQACQQRVRQMHAKNCTVVVIQPKTGNILAMAQWPTYNQATLTNVADATDLPVQDEFEPGSTAKVITAAAAFEHGGQTPMSSYYIPYSILEGGQVIHDSEWSPDEHYTIAGIIANSSNIGMSQVANHVSPQIQYEYLRNFGLGEPTGLNLPGSTVGDLPPPSQWWPDERYTLSFGQGIAVNAVQMASVYATIANGGVRVQPRLIAGITSPSGQYTPAAPSSSRRVIQAKTARELTQILQQVPAVDEEADQPWGILPGYAIASKTGTSQESGPNCALCVYGSSYIGMAPGNDPQVVVAVNVQDPDKKYGYFGDVVAGPVFYNVIKFALQTLQIPPDGAVAPHVRLNAP